VLIHAGDISNVGEPDKIEAFVRWIESQPHRHKVSLMMMTLPRQSCTS
jgi:hypothetical protein